MEDEKINEMQEQIISRQFMVKQMLINQNFQTEIENNLKAIENNLKAIEDNSKAIKELDEKYNSLNKTECNCDSQTDTRNHKGFFRRLFRID